MRETRVRRAFSPASQTPNHNPADGAYADRVRALGGDEAVDRAAFQSVAVVVLGVLERVHAHEQAVAACTLSLAQREQLTGMLATLDATTEAVQALLSPQGRTMRTLGAASTPQEPTETLWWFALAEALHALEAGLGQIISTAKGQPRGGAARRLAG